MARLVGYGGSVYIGDLVAEDCEDVWDESVDGDVIASLETTDVKVGSGSLKLVQAAGLAVADIMATEVVALGDMSGYTLLYCWAKSTVTVAAGTYRLLLDNHANCVSPEVQCDLPALTADVWKFCQCVVATGAFASATAVISIGIELEANDPGAATLYLDHILAAAEVAGIREWSIDEVVTVHDTSGFDSGAPKTFAVGQTEWSGSFNGFKDGAPLGKGTIIGLELRESDTATQQWRGSAIITGRRPAVSIDGMVMYSYDFQGTHALEEPTA